MLETIGDFFLTIFGAIGNFFVMIWNALLGLLGRIFPAEFAFMIGIIILAIIFLIIYRIVLERRPK